MLLILILSFKLLYRVCQHLKLSNLFYQLYPPEFSLLQPLNDIIVVTNYIYTVLPLNILQYLVVEEIFNYIM